ncbi:LOW QUALITY PROTEIN: Endogenous retrovirus group 3 member 1 Env polyprotein, partial [Plecturocebus cupreus]
MPMWTTGYCITMHLSNKKTVTLCITKKPQNRPTQHHLSFQPVICSDERIANNLGVSSCYVCGDTNMRDQWPWEAREVMPQENVTLTPTSPKPVPNIWLLKTSIVGRYCIAHWENTFTNPAGKLACLGQQNYNQTLVKTLWWSKNKVKRPPTLNHSWYQLETPNSWQVPPGLYWICGQRAYQQLPANWTAAYGQLLGHKTGHEDTLRFYMLHHIIRLQVVLEIITNETAQALDLLAAQSTKMKNAIYQNRLALDYLLAQEGS